jgi:hypothetical protein
MHVGGLGSRASPPRHDDRCEEPLQEVTKRSHVNAETFCKNVTAVSLVEHHTEALSVMRTEHIAGRGRGIFRHLEK